MVRISNKPNVRGIKNVSSDIEYSSKLIGREGRLFAGLIATRTVGIALGLILAVLLVVIIPYIAKLCGF
jgi:tetrahydromethanopterin S-methyltransferase subunit F